MSDIDTSGIDPARTYYLDLAGLTGGFEAHNDTGEIIDVHPSALGRTRHQTAVSGQWLIDHADDIERDGIEAFSGYIENESTGLVDDQGQMVDRDTLAGGHVPARDQDAA